ncbi:MAG: DUF1573 domain-containing protein [Bacteroidales bacterium]|nr:DUF1573 domain-containing protein [Bacteroidales bacterium]
MKKLTVLFSTLLCFVMCSFAQENVAKEQESGVVFEKLVNDYGTIEKGSDGKCSFKFTNTTDSPLILTNVQASCGCTVPSWPREAINPGESNVINVKYNTNNVGHFTKRISVFTNKQDTPIVLTITGKVVDSTPLEEVPSEK